MFRRAFIASTLVGLAGCGTVPVPPPAGPAATPTSPPPPAPSPAVPQRPPRLGLALGGGAARGFAHIGVIQVLEENGIKADLVVGTSAGSLVAALYASGRTGLDMGTLAQTIKRSRKLVRLLRQSMQ